MDLELLASYLMFEMLKLKLDLCVEIAFVVGFFFGLGVACLAAAIITWQELRRLK